mmetsp:Transcript_33125/g.106314  ORF Transcript_33125/g.106314 Transcript_33125/m.106314 type:complete len:212 (+) Transcript_33125:269-904(+)
MVQFPASNFRQLDIGPLVPVLGAPQLQRGHLGRHGLVRLRLRFLQQLELVAEQRVADGRVTLKYVQQRSRRLVPRRRRRLALLAVAVELGLLRARLLLQLLVLVRIIVCVQLQHLQLRDVLPHDGHRGGLAPYRRQDDRLHRVCQFRLEGELRRAHGGGEDGGARGCQRGTKRAVHRKGTRAGSQARCEGTEARLEGHQLGVAGEEALLGL